MLGLAQRARTPRFPALPRLLLAID